MENFSKGTLFVRGPSRSMLRVKIHRVFSRRDFRIQTSRDFLGHPDVCVLRFRTTRA